MVLLFAFLKAWFIGFAIAAPVGPIGVLCIKKTLELGFIGTLAVGLGAALADSLYGLVASAGLTALPSFLLTHSGGIRVLGGLLLLGIAYKEEHSPAVSIGALGAMNHKYFWKLFPEVVLLTLTNPLTIISYIGVFASIGSIGQCSVWNILAIVFGIFCGAFTWWATLGVLIISIRGHLPDHWLRNIRYISAAIIAGFGIFALCSVLHAISSPTSHG